MTHDNKRHGTTPLFAALEGTSGLVIGDCMPRHRAREFRAPLRRIDRAVPKPRHIPPVLDNSATPTTPEIRAGLETHPRFQLHFTPPSASWLNLGERVVAKITAKRSRRGSTSSVGDLEDAIYDDLVQHHAKPKPFTWTKTAADTLSQKRRALDALDEIRGNR